MSARRLVAIAPTRYEISFGYGDEKIASIYCPDCGEALSLARHAIGDGGNVVGAVSCAFCGFTGNVRLLKWRND